MEVSAERKKIVMLLAAMGIEMVNEVMTKKES